MVDAYSISIAGEEWHSADGTEASEVRLFAADGVLIVCMRYVPVEGNPHARGTYDIAESDLNLEGMTDEFRAGWRTWRGGMFALAQALYASKDAAVYAAMYEAIERG
jgi:hypothetical protein